MSCKLFRGLAKPNFICLKSTSAKGRAAVLHGFSRPAGQAKDNQEDRHGAMVCHPTFLRGTQTGPRALPPVRYPTVSHFSLGCGVACPGRQEP